MEYIYRVFTPGGNDTALIFGLEKNMKRRQWASREIMDRLPNVEQVGFLSKEKKLPRLLMAGGEFCGNATRAAAWCCLDGKPGEIRIKVSGVSRILRAGVTKGLDAWAQMPIDRNLNHIVEIGKGCFLVDMGGISQVVIPVSPSAGFPMPESEIKRETYRILSQRHLLGLPAAGVTFLEEAKGGLRIYPCIRVAALNTMICETACGSGTMAAGLVSSVLAGTDIDLPIIQPSGNSIQAIVKRDGQKVKEARVSGPVSAGSRVWTLKNSA